MRFDVQGALISVPLAVFSTSMSASPRAAVLFPVFDTMIEMSFPLIEIKLTSILDRSGVRIFNKGGAETLMIDNSAISSASTGLEMLRNRRKS
jgi:hypothetical protein